MKKIVIMLIFLIVFLSQILAQKLTSGLLERNQIDEKYRWNFSDIYENEQDWEKDFIWLFSNEFCPYFSVAINDLGGIAFKSSLFQ